MSAINNETELHAQQEFYSDYLPRVDSSLTIEEIQSNFNDGVVNGNLLEFKINIKDLNSVLFQTIKYLSMMRVRGIPVPANILIISVMTQKAYLYNSNEYLTYIEKVYIGAASKDNSGFSGATPKEEIDFSTSVGKERIVALLKTKRYTKINIDENCIVGWAENFYSRKIDARKQDFIGDNTGKTRVLGEVRQPTIFKEYINSYKPESNIKFEYLMDKLNDTFQKKNLGAFYTHELYAKKAHELLKIAIERVPKGNDYVIIDRCAGTGNLEQAMTTEELSHTIVSTIEYYEYKVLLEKFGDRVRHIIPPIEEPDTFNGGMVRNADALSKEYLENEIVLSYLNDKNCTIILFENPPYAETTSAEHQRKKASISEWKNSYVVQEMKKEVEGSALNDLGNAFIWSAFKYYLRQETDSYVVFSPVKYWKVQHLISKAFINGYAFNRKHFHTKINACIMCALWANKESDVQHFEINAFDINENELISQGKLPIDKVNTFFSEVYYDKRRLATDMQSGILCGLDGTERTDGRAKPLWGQDVIGYMVANGSNFDNPDLNTTLLVACQYNGNGFFLRKDNFLEKMPLFATGRYITYNRTWTERSRIMKSADGSEKFVNDVRNGKLIHFLRKCLVFVCLDTQNHIREFMGSDKRYYKNQLTLDTTNGTTLASEEITKMDTSESEKNLIAQWHKVLDCAKSTTQYKKSVNYGVHQISKELDLSEKDPKSNRTVYLNLDLHSQLQTLKTMVKDYYLEEIVPTLFEYEFLK